MLRRCRNPCLNPHCDKHSHPRTPRPVTREQVSRELDDLYHQAGFHGHADLAWTDDLRQTHDQNWRRYAQVELSETPHFELAPQAVYLPPKNRRALLAHEVGHVLDPEGGEDDADSAAYRATGVKIGYDRRWPGKGLQLQVNPDARLRELGRTVELEPGSVEARVAYANSLKLAGRREEALQHVTEALRVLLPAALNGRAKDFSVVAKIAFPNESPTATLARLFSAGEVVAAKITGLPTKKARNEALDRIVYSLWDGRRTRAVHPEGEFDRRGRWYPSSTEDGDRDVSGMVRSPSVSYPYSYMLRARTKAHVRDLVDRAFRGEEVPHDVTQRIRVDANVIVKTAWPRARRARFNPDAATRQAERSWRASGAAGDRNRWIAGLLRSGELEQALAGHPDPFLRFVGKHLRFDLNMGGGYEPTLSVTENRLARRWEEILSSTGAGVLGAKNFHSEQAASSRRWWVTYRDNRNRRHWNDRMRALHSALSVAGFQVDPHGNSMHLVMLNDENEAELIETAREIRNEYIPLLWALGGGDKGRLSRRNPDLNFGPGAIREQLTDRNPPGEWKIPPPCDPAGTGRQLAPTKLKGQKVRVHVNLHNGCYVMSQGGKVQGYTKSLKLKGVLPKVSLAGWKRCNETKVRNVHAYIEGEVAGGSSKPGKGWKKISYRCKEQGPHFFYVGTGKVFEGAQEAVFLNKGGEGFKQIEVWVKGKAAKKNPGCGCQHRGGGCSCGAVNWRPFA